MKSNRYRSLCILNGFIKNKYLSEQLENVIYELFGEKYYSQKVRAVIFTLRRNGGFLFDITNNTYTADQIVTLTPHKINTDEFIFVNQKTDLKRKR